MARTEVELLREALAKLGDMHNVAKAEISVLRAIVSSLLVIQRMDPQHGAERLAVLREMAGQALPLPDEKEAWAKEDHEMLALFTEIFDSVEFSTGTMDGRSTKN
ncbi:MAG: hypothetical protein IPK75_00565 [Acidobacteria bacterium]|nr:hypothetical protein [Acidobacteriota bacterium]